MSGTQSATFCFCAVVFSPPFPISLIDTGPLWPQSGKRPRGTGSAGGGNRHEVSGEDLALAASSLLLGFVARAQMIDNTQATNTAGAGINKSLNDEIAAGRGSVMTPGSSIYIINRDPFRSIRRGRQLFQRKFTQAQGLGPNDSDGSGDLNTNIAIGAGLSDSCAGCHGRPRGSAGSGGDVVTRPDSRDTPHLFGLGIREMLADEMTTDLRATRDLAASRAWTSISGNR